MTRRACTTILMAILLLCGVVVALVLYRCGIDPAAELIQKGRVDPILVKAAKGLSFYDIRLEFSPENKELSCFQQIDFVNQDPVKLDRLCFHLYPNAFKDPNKPVFPREEMTRAYPNGFSPGSIEILSVKLAGRPAEYEISGDSENILTVFLQKPLGQGERVALEMEYKVILPNCLGRFGYGEKSFNIANWYPIACVYDDEGWNTDPYYPIGDPFYSDTANYRVRIKAPREYVIASTGNIVEVVNEGDKKIWSIEAVAVRDFAWVASDRFRVSSKQVGGTTVYSYYYDREPGLRALEYGAAALGIFNELFGTYPYNQFSVVQTDFFIGGMEYPNIVLIDKSLYAPGEDPWLEVVTVHETAHQWWYAMVGNDEVDDAWLDEALAEYSTVLYYRHRYGPEKEKEMLKELATEGKYYLLDDYLKIKSIDETIHRPVYDFADWIVYDFLVYGKGAMMFHELRNQVGEGMFYEILRAYFKENQFQNAVKEDLLRACEKVTGEKWDAFFEDWLYDEKQAFGPDENPALLFLCIFFGNLWNKKKKVILEI